MKRILIHIAVFLLLLFCSASHALAGLSMGVVPDAGRDLMSSGQAAAFAEALGEGLGETITVREFSDYDQLRNWLNRFAQIDLALVGTETAEEKPGEFLVLGTVDPAGQVTLVTRQGTTGDLPQRITALLKTDRTALWSGGVRSATIPELAAIPAPEPIPTLPPADVSVAAPVESAPIQSEKSTDSVEHVPPLQPGKAWQPEGDMVTRDILAGQQPYQQKLVFGVVPGSGQLIQEPSQAEKIAGYLENQLAIPVVVRVFDDIVTLADWFQNYGMVDLAVLRLDARKDPFQGNYQPLVSLFRTGVPRSEAPDLMVIRRELPQDTLVLLQQALMNIEQTADGKTLLADLAIGRIVPAGSQPPDEELPEAIVEQPPVTPAVEEPVAVRPVSPVTPETPVVAELLQEQPAPQAPQLLPAIQEPLVLSATEPVEPIASPEMPVPPAAVVVALPESPGAVPLIPEGPQVETIASPSPPVEPPVMPQAPEVSGLPVDSPPVPVEPLPVEVTEAPVPAVEAIVVPVAPVVVGAPVLPDVAPPSLSQTEVLPAIPEDLPAVVDAPEAAPGTEKLEASPAAPAASVDERAEAPVVEAEEPAVVEEQLGSAAVAGAGSTPGPIVPVLELPEGETLTEPEVAALLESQDLVAGVIAQPDLPQELRPPGVPIPRPGRIPKKKAKTDEPRLLASLPKPLARTPEPEPLLPPPEPEPRKVYIVPFVAIMVPAVVQELVFDQFVDALIDRGEELDLDFVILKEGLAKVDPEWLKTRKYVTGEIYAYVEDSGCCTTDLRARARMNFYKAYRRAPEFSFEYPVSTFFDHDSSTLEVERLKLSDEIALALADELFKNLEPRKTTPASPQKKP